jgi:hypothetical protein
MDETLAVTEMLDFVDFNAERAAQEAAEEDDMLLFITERRVFFDSYGQPILDV